ncbi:DUF2533 family protein [Tepidibacillus infernus]|uniref:Uncharacterized protein n=1 Tax=Tepidibacillus decaturensis TaxID=1413211 RepID=A0A135L2S7_9BACI|nr:MULTISPECIES: DUF2533 family protein [Tepidibacillus]KXG43153.1 hypothetical protein U473_03290 [Tepidibacillus decaturensis]GBF10107.1 hypothetical protein HK1_00119 [Tepidibacillus sp. HK-1]
MNSVHLEISKKVNEKVHAIEVYKQMDQQRERIIDELLTEYKIGKNVDLTKLNQWTNEMNRYALKNQLPSRKEVTMEMFTAYANKMKTHS